MLTALFFIAALLLVGSAAISSAKMDTVKDHWSISIYNTDRLQYPPIWYQADESWVLKKPEYEGLWHELSAQFLPWYMKWLRVIKPQWDPISDYWHVEKAKLICSVLGVASCAFLAGYFYPGDWKNIITIFVLLAYLLKGGLWNLIFNYYYNRKLVRKGYKKRWLWLKEDSTQS